MLSVARSASQVDDILWPIHTADAMQQDRRVGVRGANWCPEQTRLFSDILNVFRCQIICRLSAAVFLSRREFDSYHQRCLDELSVLWSTPKHRY